MSQSLKQSSATASHGILRWAVIALTAALLFPYLFPRQSQRQISSSEETISNSTISNLRRRTGDVSTGDPKGNRNGDRASGTENGQLMMGDLDRLLAPSQDDKRRNSEKLENEFAEAGAPAPRVTSGAAISGAAEQNEMALEQDEAAASARGPSPLSEVESLLNRRR